MEPRTWSVLSTYSTPELPRPLKCTLFKSTLLKIEKEIIIWKSLSLEWRKEITFFVHIGLPEYM
jgi:hypothetical protein